MIKIRPDNASRVIVLYFGWQKDRQCKVHGTSSVGLVYVCGSLSFFPDIWLDTANSHVTHEVLNPVHNLQTVVTVREALRTVLTAVQIWGFGGVATDRWAKQCLANYYYYYYYFSSSSSSHYTNTLLT